MKDEISNKF